MKHSNRGNIRLIGNALVDRVMFVPRYPKEDEELRAQGFEQRSGGNACNTALWLAKAGYPVELVASMAMDDDGRWLRAQLEQAGVDLSLCQVHARGRTPQSSVWLVRRGATRSIVHYRDLAELSLEHLRTLDDKNYGWLHLEGRNIETLSSWLGESVMDRSRVSLELEKPRPGLEDLLDRVAVAVVSSHYLRETGETVDDGLARLQLHRPWLSLVYTEGAKGVRIRATKGDRHHLPPPRVIDEGDSLGAGDVFMAGLIAALYRDHGLLEAVEKAQQAALKQLTGVKPAEDQDA